jgi:uncharacterized protein YihD (DUF1040 family)
MGNKKEQNLRMEEFNLRLTQGEFYQTIFPDDMIEKHMKIRGTDRNETIQWLRREYNSFEIARAGVIINGVRNRNF